MKVVALAASYVVAEAQAPVGRLWIEKPHCQGMIFPHEENARTNW